MPPVRDLLVRYREQRLQTHTTAIAFRILVALVPLSILGVALLGALGLEDVWGGTVGPGIQGRVAIQVYAGMDHTVQEIFRADSALLVALAGALLFWHTFRAVRATSLALNDVHGVEEDRPWWKVAAVGSGLAVGAGLCVLGAFLAVSVGGRDGLLLSLARWPVAAVLLGAAVALLLRYAPAEHPEPRWASAGAGAIVAGWIVLSAAFGLWAGKVASYQSAAGILLAFLLLTTYVLAVAAVFLGGALLDEELRRSRPRTKRGTPAKRRTRAKRRASAKR